MGALVSNNGWGELSVAVSATHNQILLTGGQGERFPNAVAPNSWFFVTVVDEENNLEIMRVINRNADTFEVERGWDNTQARAFPQGAKVELRPCAALFNDKVSNDALKKQLTELRDNLEQADEKLYDQIEQNRKDVDAKLEADFATIKYVDDKFTELGDTMDEEWVSIEYGDEHYVLKEGDTMTGPLGIKSEKGAGFTVTGGDIRVRTWTNTETEHDYGGNITCDGTVTAEVVSTASDERLKENISALDLRHCLSVLSQLEPVYFTWKKSGETDYGLIAQDVQDVIPDIVHEREDGYLTVSYQSLIPILIRVVNALVVHALSEKELKR